VAADPHGFQRDGLWVKTSSRWEGPAGGAIDQSGGLIRECPKGKATPAAGQFLATLAWPIRQWDRSPKIGTAPTPGRLRQRKEGDLKRIVLPAEGLLGHTAEPLTLEKGQHPALGAPRTTRRPFGRSMGGLHSPILLDPAARRMAGPPEGNGLSIPWLHRMAEELPRDVRLNPRTEISKNQQIALESRVAGNHPMARSE